MKNTSNYRCIDNDWDLDEFQCMMNGKLYVNGVLKANLLPGGQSYILNGGLLATRLFFPCYGAGLYRIEEEHSSMLIKINDLGVVLADSWQCGTSLFFYFDSENKIKQMSYNFGSCCLCVSHKYSGELTTDIYALERKGFNVSKFGLEEQFADCFFDLCGEIELDLDVKKVELYNEIELNYEKE
jgi:hypothetical protein